MATISISHNSYKVYQLIDSDDYYHYMLTGWKKSSPKKHLYKPTFIPCTPIQADIIIEADIINEVVNCGACGYITLTWIKED